MLEERFTVRQPASLMGAQYSLPFTAAVALARDLSSPLAYDQTVLNDATVRGLVERIAIEPATPVRVRLDLEGGSFDLPMRPAKGSAANPYTWSEMYDKFCRYAGAVIEERRLAEIAAAVECLDDLPDVAALAALLRG
jgi:2-methylcitrate dehydratase PrpD